MIKFHPNKEVNAKYLHNGSVIYADDTCIRVLSAGLLGEGGGRLLHLFFYLVALSLLFGWG